MEVKEEPTEEGENEEDMDEPGCSSLATSDQYDRSQLPDLLRVYYTWLFPYDKYFDWLHYGIATYY